jgi:translation initiation factor IF-3
LIDETGKQLGVMPTRQALLTAQERGLDLVEVAPGSRPPVCRLMDFGKFKYEATRREREARRAQRGKTTNELREVRLEGRIGDHDLETKIRQVKRLLGEGSKVRVSVRFRGREITHPEIGMALLRRVAEALVDVAGMEKTPSFEGRFLTMILTPATAAGGTAKPKAPETQDKQKETTRA